MTPNIKMNLHGHKILKGQVTLLQSNLILLLTVSDFRFLSSYFFFFFFFYSKEKDHPVAIQEKEKTHKKAVVRINPWTGPGREVTQLKFSFVSASPEALGQRGMITEGSNHLLAVTSCAQLHSLPLLQWWSTVLKIFSLHWKACHCHDLNVFCNNLLFALLRKRDSFYPLYQQIHHCVDKNVNDCQDEKLNIRDPTPLRI